MTVTDSGAERHRAREAALQLLYQWEVGRVDADALGEAGDVYWASHPAPAPRREFADKLVTGTTTRLDTIDPLLEEHAENWRLSRMAVIDRLIMRMAVYELLFEDTPVPVVIDEALELAKTFGGDQAVRFVNGVLDSIRRALDSRKVEAADR